MNLLDLLRNSKLKINTPDGSQPQTYSEDIIQSFSVKFPANISSGGVFNNYIRIEGTGAVARPSGPPTVLTYYLTTEASEQLLTEAGDNIITTSQII